MNDLARVFSKYHQMNDEERLVFRRELRRQIELSQQLAAEHQASYIARKAIEKAKRHD